LSAQSYRNFSLALIAAGRGLSDDCRKRFRQRPVGMLRTILAFVLCFVLTGGASAAAIAAGAPAPAKVAFLVCLGLFVAAIVDGVVERPRHSSSEIGG
jgi:hypothetical protein